MPGRRRIHLLRHASVEYFTPDGRPHPSESVALSPAGRVEAEAAAAALAEVPFDLAVTSGLPRARETARIVLRERGVDVREVAALREIRPGRLRDIPEEALRSTFLRAFHGLTRDSRFLGGERFGAFVDRVLPAFEELCREPGWRRALLVLHGGVNRVILADALGAGLTDGRTDALGGLEQDPGCINILDVNPDGRRIVRLVNLTPADPLKRRVERTSMELLLEAYRPSAAGDGPTGQVR
jgi:probable phosphoglycerate mutase